jgi:hypothetical protein
MAMKRKISEFFSTYSIKDDATTTVKKITKEQKNLDKSLRGSQKEFNKLQKDIAKSKRELVSYNKETQKAHKAGGGGFFGNAKQKLQRGGDIAGGAAGGNVFGSIGKTIPFLGALVVAGVASIEKAAAAIDQAASVLQQRAGFGRVQAAGGAGFGLAQQQLRGAFSETDIENALAQLGEKGISDLSQRQIEVIRTEAMRSGGVTQAVENILSGTGFRTLGQEGKNLESIAENLDYSSQAAATSFQIITDQLSMLQKNQASLIDRQAAVTTRAREKTGQADFLQRSREDRAVGLSDVKDIVAAVNTVEDITNTFVKKTAIVAADKIEDAKRIIDDPTGYFSAWGKSLKHAINPFSSGADAEGGLNDFFRKDKKSGTTPGPSPEPAPPMQSSNGVNNVFNITMNISGAGNPESVAQMVQQNFASFIDSYANTILARELNLNGG